MLAGCGGDDEGTQSQSELPSAGGGGALTYALPELPASLDPLAADTRPEQVVARQVHEPLVASLTGPYGATATSPGLALSVKPSPDRTLWKAILRSGVRFQDGTPFNASAVLANSRRWNAESAGRRLLPGLFAVDAPRPNEVRFQFERPQPEVSRLLSSPQLGIVSPEALETRPGEGSRFRRSASGTGTGAFELGAAAGDRIELGRNAQWWGSSEGLGPALDALAFVAEPSAAGRVELLRAGEAEVAEPVGAGLGEALAEDPLLRLARGPGGGIGFEASVRGLQAGSAVPVLSGVWLTTLSR